MPRPNAIVHTNLSTTAAECLPDADDTSRVILALNGLGKTAAPDAMIASLEGADHFLTYQGERNPSFSTNCNVAACLLNQNDPSRYSSQIQKCIQFLCNYAYNKEIDDKWVSRVHCLYKDPC